MVTTNWTGTRCHFATASITPEIKVALQAAGIPFQHDAENGCMLVDFPEGAHYSQEEGRSYWRYNSVAFYSPILSEEESQEIDEEYEYVKGGWHPDLHLAR